LPKHRGPSPIQATILEGDTTSGVTLMLTAAKMDAGDIISQIEVELSQSETSTTLKDYLAGIAATLVLNSIPYYLAKDLRPQPQKEEEASYSKMIKKEEGLVDENTDALTLNRKVRAFDRWPSVYIIVGKKRVQILSTHFDESGKLVIDRVRPEGKKEMAYADFINGYGAKLTFH